MLTRAACRVSGGVVAASTAHRGESSTSVWVVWDPYTSQARIESKSRVVVNAALRDYVVRHAKAGPDLPVPLDDAVVGSEQDLPDAFTEDGVLPGKVDFGQFVGRRFAEDIEKGQA